MTILMKWGGGTPESESPDETTDSNEINTGTNLISIKIKDNQ